ncbi:DUF3108 domain-containing protein [Thalassotalea sp. G2M2-11]|uniref:DUF3108 domain-containing protein n=1 Tax=Thalassotalea sp. G2M2-11 TaxID=2787627 RepID=UPI0019D27114|nr:DUF3108 domain-containing protein [Thalassotalea sp. G2M2-11]
MNKSLCHFCFVFVAFLTLDNTAQAQQKETGTVIKPFTAHYNILHKSSPVGTGIRTLKYLNDDQVQYSYQTEIEWLIFSDVRKESTRVKLNDNHVTPLQYQFTREGTGRDKAYDWQYDIEKNLAKDLKKNRKMTVNFPENIQDKLSYHLQNRLNLIANPEQKLFVYPVISTSGSIKNYVYQYEGIEDVMLPYGLVKAVKLKREVVEKKRITYAWFAPELNYLLVKLYQVKGGVEQFEAQLSKLSISDEQTTTSAKIPD